MSDFITVKTIGGHDQLINVDSIAHTGENEEGDLIMRLSVASSLTTIKLAPEETPVAISRKIDIARFRPGGDFMHHGEVLCSNTPPESLYNAQETPEETYAVEGLYAGGWRLVAECPSFSLAKNTCMAIFSYSDDHTYFLGARVRRGADVLLSLPSPEATVSVEPTSRPSRDYVYVVYWNPLPAWHEHSRYNNRTEAEDAMRSLYAQSRPSDRWKLICCTNATLFEPVNDIMPISQIEGGIFCKLDVPCEPVNLNGVTAALPPPGEYYIKYSFSNESIAMWWRYPWLVPLSTQESVCSVVTKAIENVPGAYFKLFIVTEVGTSRDFVPSDIIHQGIRQRIWPDEGLLRRSDRSEVIGDEEEV